MSTQLTVRASTLARIIQGYRPEAGLAANREMMLAALRLLATTPPMWRGIALEACLRQAWEEDAYDEVRLAGPALDRLLARGWRADRPAVRLLNPRAALRRLPPAGAWNVRRHKTLAGVVITGEADYLAHPRVVDIKSTEKINEAYYAEAWQVPIYLWLHDCREGAYLLCQTQVGGGEGEYAMRITEVAEVPASPACVTTLYAAAQLLGELAAGDAEMAALLRGGPPA